MKTLAFVLLATCATVVVKAQTKPIKIIQGKDTLITANTTWDCDTIYFMKGKIYVTNSAELTIQPGTVIFGDTITKGALIITRGSKIHAVGTPTCPIVFTSSKRVGRRNRGDWGGVIILGRSTTNSPGGVQFIEGLPQSNLTQFGGGANPDIHDNSGELKYVRIEFAGVALSPNNEINGLTMGGVGDGTLIDFVQVSYSNDDSFEWFGGTVNAKHLIAFRGIDDDFDTDNGFTGKVQFGIGLRDPNVADVSGSNGFESDNDASGDGATPQTRAVFSNMTVCAGSDSATNVNYRNGALPRRNTHIYIYNSIIMGYPTGISVDGTATNSNVLSDTMIQNNIIAATQSSKWVVSTTNDAAVVNLLRNNAHNRFYFGNDSPGVRLVKPYALGSPDLRPGAGSPALSGVNWNHIGLVNNPFFTHTSYVGALSRKSSENWATVWVNWKPTQTDYRVLCACSTQSLASANEEEDAIGAVKGETKVYPNPTHGSFNVDLNGFSGNVTIKVTNMSGAVVYTKQTVATAKNIVNVNLNRATAGLYYVTVTDGKYSTTTKVNIVQ